MDRSQWWRSRDGAAARPRTGLRSEATPTRAPATASGPARAILELQRSVGNQAVARAISGGGALTPAAAKPVVVARQADTGLAAAKPTGKFAGAALAFWRSKANKQRPLTDFGDFLIEQANDRLKALGVPPCSHSYDENKETAKFSVVSWAIKLNPQEFASSSTVGSLSVREASARVGYVYHEARHAEQHFRVARVLAGQRKSATEIQQQIDLPGPLAVLAAQAPLRDGPRNRRLVAEAAGWIPFYVGRYELYQYHLNQLDAAADRYSRGVQAWADVPSTDTDAESQRALHQKAVRVAWDDIRAIFDDYLEAKLREVEKLPRKSRVDRLVQRDLRKLWSVFTSLRQEVAKPPHEKIDSEIRQLKLAIKLEILSDRAYRIIATEKDAYAAEAAVTAAFRRKARR